MSKHYEVIVNYRGETVRVKFDNTFSLSDFINAMSNSVNPPKEFLVNIVKDGERLPEVF